MASKPKEKLFSVHHRGRASHGGFGILNGYVVCARNESEACEIIQTGTEKHRKLDAQLIANHEALEKYKCLKHGEWKHTYERSRRTI